MIPHFTQVAVGDFEYEVTPGNLPDVLCMAVHILDEHLNHVRTISMWRGEFGARPPFDTANTLFVGYSLWAEMICFMQLGWKFPTYVLDLHTAYLSVSNILAPYSPDEPRKKDRKRLSDACKAYNIDGWEDVDKEKIAKDIGEGRWRMYGRPRVAWYNNEDVRVEGRVTAENAARVGKVPAHRRTAGHALVQLLCESSGADTSPRDADRRAPVEPGAGKQGDRYQLPAATVRSELRQ